MQLHPTSRPRRVRRLIAISAAAVAVMIAPTACDYGGSGNYSGAGHADGHGAQPTVVPVGNTVNATPEESATTPTRRPRRLGVAAGTVASGVAAATTAGGARRSVDDADDDPGPGGRGNG